MAKENPVSAVDDAISQTLRQLKALRNIRELAKHQPELLQDLIAKLGAESNGKYPQRVQRSRDQGKTTIFQKIQDFFKANGNEWSTAPRIMQDTGLSRGAVSHTVYKSHADRFEQKNHPTNRRMKLWHLKGGDNE